MLCHSVDRSCESVLHGADSVVSVHNKEGLLPSHSVLEG